MGARSLSLPFELRYTQPLEEAVEEVAQALDGGYGLAPRSIALLLLQGDEATVQRVGARQPEVVRRSRELAQALEAELGQPVALAVAAERYRWSQRVAAAVVQERAARDDTLGERLGRWAMHPWVGLLMMAGVL